MVSANQKDGDSVQQCGPQSRGLVAKDGGASVGIVMVTRLKEALRSVPEMGNRSVTVSQGPIGKTDEGIPRPGGGLTFAKVN